MKNHMKKRYSENYSGPNPTHLVSCEDKVHKQSPGGLFYKPSLQPTFHCSEPIYPWEEHVYTCERQEGKSNWKKGKESITNISSQEDSNENTQEARKTWKIDKQLGPYAEMEEVVIQNLTKVCRSSRKRSIPRRYKWCDGIIMIWPQGVDWGSGARNLYVFLGWCCLGGCFLLLFQFNCLDVKLLLFSLMFAPLETGKF